LRETKTNKQIDAAFSVWQSVCGLSFQKFSTSEDHEIKISFLNDHDSTIDCPCKLNGQRCGTLVHVFYPGSGQICGDIHFDNANWTPEKTKPGDGK